MKRAAGRIGTSILLYTLTSPAIAADDKPPGRETAPIGQRSEGASPEASDAEGRASVAGTVRDPAGQLIAGATAWLVTGDRNGFDPPLETVSDADGRIAFAKVGQERMMRAGSRAPTVIVRDKTGRLGWRQLSNPPLQRRDVEIRLRIAADLSGRVLGPDGKPFAGARLRCEAFFIPNSVSPDALAELFPKLAADYTATTDAEGQFLLSLVPAGVRLRCRLTAAGFSDARIVLETGEPAEIKLAEPGTIAGKLVFPDGADRTGFEYRLQIESQHEAKDKTEAAQVTHSQVTASDASGSFHFDGLLPGLYRISPVGNQNGPFFAEPTELLQVEPGRRMADVLIPLKTAQQVRGRVVDATTGDGIEQAELVVRVSGVRDDQEVVTDAKGRFAAWLPPGKVSVGVRDVPLQYALPRPERVEYRDLPDSEWPAIELARAVVLEGTVVDEAGKPVPFAHLDISIDRVRMPPQIVRLPFAGQALARPRFVRRPDNDIPQAANGSGKFTIGRLDPGQSLKLRARTAQAATDGAISVTLSQLGGPVTLVVSPKHACRVIGQILDDQGASVPQTQVLVTARRRQDLPGGLTSYPDTVADEPTIGPDGRFESEALWAGESYFLRVAADGFTDVTTDLIATDSAQVYDFGPVVLHRMTMFRAQVVDASGQAVPNADLRVQLRSVPRTGGFASKTDARGQYGLQVDRDTVVSVWARAGSAVSNGAAVTIAALANGDASTITISEQFAFRYTGKILDRRGQPVEGATVHVVWIDDPQRNGGQPMSVLQRRAIRKSQHHVSESKAAADGTFVTEPLWPDLYYNVAVLAEGCQTWESPTLLAQTGETRDLGEIVLTRTRLSVEGRVIDAKDRPIVGATVINSGDADRPLSTQTAADGTFKFESLPDGPVYLLVRKTGYWPSGARRHAGDRPFDVMLLEETRARAVSNRPQAKESSDEERQFVREGLQQLWKLRDRFQTSVGLRGRRSAGKAQLIECMAAIDLEQALGWSAAENGNYDDEARLAAAARLVVRNVDDALLLADVANDRADYTLRAMASRLLAMGANEDALRVLRAELAPRQTRGRLTLRHYSGATKKAQIGRMALHAGADDWGRQLILEAADELDKHLDDEESFEARTDVAEALAAVDQQRAMKVWKTLPIERRGYSESYHWRIAAALAAHDLPNARKILHTVETVLRGDGRRFNGVTDQARAAMAYELAHIDLDAALALLDEKPFATAGGKAEAFSWLAVAVAKYNRPRAWQLIDQALDLCLDHTENEYVSFNGGRPFNAARIAIKAQKLGYPDMPSLVDRVLATRSTPLEVPSAATLAESTLTVARLLALIEPKLARELLVSLEPQATLIGSGKGRIERGDLLTAWALVDLTRARQLFADELARQQQQPMPELSDSGLVPLLQMLVLPPAERAGFLESGLAYTFTLPFTD